MREITLRHERSHRPKAPGSQSRKRSGSLLAFTLLLLLCLVFSGCVKATPVEGDFAVPPFSVIIDGETYTQDTFSNLQVYECTATSTNRYGTEETYVYTGYQLEDVLTAAGETTANGVTTVGSDGYEVDLDAKETSDSTTLVAFWRDGKPSSENGTIFVVPCKSDFSPDYAKDVTEIIINEAA